MNGKWVKKNVKSSKEIYVFNRLWEEKCVENHINIENLRKQLIFLKILRRKKYKKILDDW